jgi:hypothetical protein
VLNSPHGQARESAQPERRQISEERPAAAPPADCKTKYHPIKHLFMILSKNWQAFQNRAFLFYQQFCIIVSLVLKQNN